VLRCHGFHGSTDSSDIPPATVEKVVEIEPVSDHQAVTVVFAGARYLYLFL